MNCLAVIQRDDSEVAIQFGNILPVTNPAVTLCLDVLRGREDQSHPFQFEEGTLAKDLFHEVAAGKQMQLGNLTQTLDSTDTVEARVEAQQSGHPVPLHDCGVHRVPCRESGNAHHQRLGLFHVGPLDRIDLVDDSQERVEGRLDGIGPADGMVAVEDFLEDFRVGDQAISAADEVWRSRTAAILLGCSAPTRYMGMLESRKITGPGPTGTPPRFPRACGEDPRWGTRAGTPPEPR